MPQPQATLSNPMAAFPTLLDEQHSLSSLDTMTQSTHQVAPPSSPKPKATFLTLPRELRDTIYELALTDTVVHIKEPATSTPHHLALLLRSRQVRHEAAPYYYKLSTFYVDDTAVCVSWWRDLPAEARDSVRELRCVKPYLDALNAFWLRSLDQEDAEALMRASFKNADRALREVRGVFGGAGEGVMKIGIEKYNGLVGKQFWSAEPEGEEIPGWKEQWSSVGQESGSRVDSDG